MNPTYINYIREIGSNFRDSFKTDRDVEKIANLKIGDLVTPLDRSKTFLDSNFGKRFIISKVEIYKEDNPLLNILHLNDELATFSYFAWRFSKVESRKLKFKDVLKVQNG